MAMTHVGHGLDIEQAEDIIRAWRKRDLARFEGDTAIVERALCGVHGIPADDVAQRKAILVAMIEAHDCKMSNETGEAVLLPAGFTEEEIPLMVLGLAKDELALLDDAGVTLLTENCPK